MYKIVALFGESGAGKDTTLKAVCENTDFNKIITCTTRPKRDYEVDGIDYHFLTIPQFSEKVLNGDMIEATTFNEDWFYGTDIKTLKEDKINIGVFNPGSIECMFGNPDLELHLIYISASDKVRLLRNLNREANPDCREICRRFLADKKDFEVLTTWPCMHVFDTEEEESYDGLIRLIESL